MPDTWRVEVDRSICIGSGMCVACAPDDFSLGTGLQAAPRAEEMDASEKVMEAAESCPVEAISVVDAGTGATLFPPD